MNDFISDYASSVEKQRKEAAVSRKNLIRALRDAGVTKVTVEFDGSGDSGNIYEPVFDPPVKNIMDREVHDTTFEASDWSDGTLKKVVRNKSIRDLLDDVCYGILGAEHGGWEINEGSFGTFHINVEKDAVALDYNHRRECYDSYEEEY